MNKAALPYELSKKQLKLIQTRAKTYGASQLSDFELLVASLALINSPVNAFQKAKQFFAQHAGLEQLQYFTNEQWQQLSEEAGGGELLQAAVELFARMHRRPAPLLGQVVAIPELAAHLQQLLGHLKQEVLHVLCLNPQNMIVCQREVFRGTLDATLIHPREILACALKYRAAKIILAHNHPSDYVHPSANDLKVTTRMQQAANLIGIAVVDHIIVGRSKYFSFSEADLLPQPHVE